MVQEKRSPRFLAGLDTLQTRVSGSVYTPESDGYDDARRAWNLLVDQHPAVIVAAQSASDVAAAVNFANDADLSVTVMATGHGVILPADDSLLIVTSGMKDVQINLEARSARIEAGAQWSDVLPLAQEHGLTPLLGSAPGVGAVGYTLGGGLGWLARKYGLAADRVRAFEVVTPDGQMVRASQDEHADLFWALRGGGGNFGVVTTMEMELVPVSKVYAGNLYYPVEQAGAVIRRYRDWVADAPEELTSAVVLMQFPPFDEVPEFLRGQTFVIVRGCYCGEIADGEALVQPWRDWQAPVMDDFRAMPFSESGTISNDPPDPMPSFSTSVGLRHLDDSGVDTLVQYGPSAGGDSPLLFAEVRHAGGALARDNVGSSANGCGDSEFVLHLIAIAPTPEAETQLYGYARSMVDALGGAVGDTVYMNFVEGHEARNQTRNGFTPEAYHRLRQVKAAYDPNDHFRHSYDFT